MFGYFPNPPKTDPNPGQARPDSHNDPGPQGTKTRHHVASIVPDAPDSRDYLYDRLLETESRLQSPPETLDLRSQLPEVRDQGPQGTCAAFVGACIKEYHERVERNFQGHFSPAFIYRLKNKPWLSGMTARELMKILQKRGTVLESEYPYAAWQANQRRPISAQLYEMAKRNRIKSYARVRSIKAAKMALSQTGVLLMALPVVTYAQAEFWKMPAGSWGSQFYGGHAIAVVGYTKEGFILRNSWGKDWGNQGYVTLPFSDWSYVWDVYSAVDEETAEKIKPDPPQPSPPQPPAPQPSPPQPSPPPAPQPNPFRYPCTIM